MIELNKAALRAARATMFQDSIDAEDIIRAYIAALPPPVVTEAMWRDAREKYCTTLNSAENEWKAVCAVVLRHVGPQASHVPQASAPQMAPSASAPADLADLADLAEAAADVSYPSGAYVNYFRAAAADHRRVAALDAEVLRVMKSYLDVKSRTGIMCVIRALARRLGGTL